MWWLMWTSMALADGVKDRPEWSECPVGDSTCVQPVEGKNTSASSGASTSSSSGRMAELTEMNARVVPPELGGLFVTDSELQTATDAQAAMPMVARKPGPNVGVWAVAQRETK